MIKVALIIHNGLTHPALASEVRTVYFDRAPTSEDLRSALQAPEDDSFCELLNQSELPEVIEAAVELGEIGVVTLTCHDPDSSRVVGAIVLEEIDVLVSSALQLG